MKATRPNPSQYSWLFVPLVVFFGILLAGLAVSWFPINWSTWRPADCMPHKCFCEKVHSSSSIRQPLNTYSNLAFVLAGLLVLGSLRRPDSPQNPRPNNPIHRNNTYTTVFGVSLFLIGVTSMFFHASLSFLGEWFDLLSMYMLGSFMLLYGLLRYREFSPVLFVSLYLIANIIFGLTLWNIPFARREGFGLLALLALLTELYITFVRKPQMKTRYIGIAVISMTIAIVFWTIDIQGQLCWPSSWLQGHAIWHVLCALAAWYTFQYYASEEQTPHDTTS